MKQSQPQRSHQSNACASHNAHASIVSRYTINGTEITDFHAGPPPKGGPPGVYAESGSTAVTWVFPRVQLF